MDAVTINNKPFPTLEYKNQRVVTFEMIDEVHERVDGAARGEHLSETEVVSLKGWILMLLIILKKGF
ncbi:hypothetical protein HTZ85_26210 [Escherichia coli]|nr:hypothetical protein [Escherichia coli]